LKEKEGMAIVTIEVPDELAEQVRHEKARLPELLAQSLQRPSLPVETYRYVLEFLVSNPSPGQLAAFGLTPEMAATLQVLTAKEKAGEIMPAEEAALGDYRRMEHLIGMAKTGELHYVRVKH
jgi:hypothetical protein